MDSLKQNPKQFIDGKWEARKLEEKQTRVLYKDL